MAEPIHLGFPGTINAQQQATWLPRVSGRFGVVGADDLQVVRNTSLDRGISINGGRGWGDAVFSIFDEGVPAATYGLPLPDGPAGTVRWHMVVARRDWQNPYTVTFPYIDAGPGPTPAQLPARSNNAGVTSDQPLALVEVIAGQSTVGQIIDLRCWDSGSGLLAKHLLALDYLEEIAARVRIGANTHTFVLGDNDVTQWESDEPVTYAPGTVAGWASSGYTKTEKAGSQRKVTSVLTFKRTAGEFLLDNVNFSVMNPNAIPSGARPSGGSNPVLYGGAMLINNGTSTAQRSDPINVALNPSGAVSIKAVGGSDLLVKKDSQFSINFHYYI